MPVSPHLNPLPQAGEEANERLREFYSNELPERLAAQIAPLTPVGSTILIGLSGGVDSVVLLHLLQQLAPRFSWRLSALHVHHGISTNADAWADFCTKLCARHAIPLHIEHVNIALLRKHGIEAAARQLRYAAFARQACDFVALAHHADDQAETLLLQLLRGAGVRGASAMPVLSQSKRPVLITSDLPACGLSRMASSSISTSKRSLLTGSKPASTDTARTVSNNVYTGAIVRPLLHCSRQEILDYATAADLRWVEDESNACDSYPRNFLRHRVLPLLEEKFPAYRASLSRSAQHFAEAGELLDDLARLDAAQTILNDTLLVAALQTLSQPRAKNLLRYFLRSIGAPLPQAVQLDDMLDQLCNARTNAMVCIAYGEWQVRRYQGKVYVLRALGEFDQSLVLTWQGETELDWPALDERLRFTRTNGQGSDSVQDGEAPLARFPHPNLPPQTGEGVNESLRDYLFDGRISLAKLQHAPVTLRLRCGGETLRPHANAATRTLKNLLQEHHIPPWQRMRLPLLYCGEKLVCVVGVAIAAEYQAASDEPGIMVGFCS